MSGADSVADGAAVQEGTIGRKDAARIAAASLISAGVGYAVLAIAARVLDSVQDNTVFVTFWSAVFLCFGMLSGLSIETTRAVSASASMPVVDRRPRVISVGLLCGGAVVALLAAASPLWAPRLFPSDPWVLGALACAGVGAYAGHSVVVGALAGRRSWSTYAKLIGADSAVRLALILVAAALGFGVLGFAGATVLAAATWIVFVVVSPTARRAAGAKADSSTSVFLRRIGAASTATGASAVLVVGFPVLLSLTTPVDDYRDAAPVLLALTLTRAPLMIPLNAYQGVAVSHFVANRDRGLRAMLPAARAVALVGLAGAALAYVIGPWLMTVLLGPRYEVAGSVLAGLTVASAVLALLTLTGALCQALTLHTVFVAGWLSAVVVAVVLLLVPLDMPTRAVLALTIGPAVGLVVHLAALGRANRGATPGDLAG